jgi:L-threonylcarbamoyladenylate synthase
MLTADDAATFERCMAVGGIAVFPSDTVYGLACDADAREAIERLYALKRRSPDKPSGVMLFSVELALAALPELRPREAAAIEALMPGEVTLLLPNPAGRFPLAAGGDPSVLGLRVPALPPTAAALGRVNWPILQSSANFSGAPDARTVEDVPAALRDAVDLVLDAGPLPGTPSTVVDLREFEASGRWTITREGALHASDVAARLDAL